MKKHILKFAIIGLTAVVAVVSCRKEKDFKEDVNIKDLADVVVGDGTRPNLVNFFNEALSPYGVQDNYHKDSVLLFSEAVANHLYTSEASAGHILVPKKHGKLTLNIAVSGDSCSKANINTFLSVLNDSATQIARDNGFASDPNITFGLFGFSKNVGLSSPSLLVIDIVYRVDIGKAMPPGCAVQAAYAIHTPNENNGDPCYTDEPNQHAFEKIENRLNTPALCNVELKCDNVLDFTPQPSKYGPIYDRIIFSKMATEYWDITPVIPAKTGISQQTVFDNNFWTAPWEDQKQCVTPLQIENWYYYTVAKSVTTKPIYDMPGTSISFPKSIDKYKFNYFWNEPIGGGPPPYTFLFSNLSDAAAYHYCIVYYKVCVKIPVYPIATKTPSDWRNTI